MLLETPARITLCVLRRSVMSDTFVTPWTVAHQAPLSVGFSRQEYRSGLPFPLPRDLPDPGIELMSSVSCVSSIGRWVLYP